LKWIARKKIVVEQLVVIVVVAVGNLCHSISELMRSLSSIVIQAKKKLVVVVVREKEASPHSLSLHSDYCQIVAKQLLGRDFSQHLCDWTIDFCVAEQKVMVCYAYHSVSVTSLASSTTISISSALPPSQVLLSEFLLIAVERVASLRLHPPGLSRQKFPTRAEKKEH
jgi:hypothetical protein